MPLKAISEHHEVFAFNYDEAMWSALKDRTITMSCCGTKAVLKKSKLGTKFFAHHRKNACDSVPETAEHLYVKNQICEIAKSYGWDVQSEKKGKTPDGQEWIADVYCEKGNTKIVFEVQWSYQHVDEFYSRHKKYIDSGIRAAWFYRLHGRQERIDSELRYNHKMPVFGIKVSSKDRKNITVPEFNIEFENLITGMLTKQLKFGPDGNDIITCEVAYDHISCWRCKKKTGVVFGASLVHDIFGDLGFNHFSDKLIAEHISKHMDLCSLDAHGIGEIKQRYSKTLECSYLSNGCLHCDAIFGDHYVFLEYASYFYSLSSDKKPASPLFFRCKLKDIDPDFHKEWRFLRQR